MTKLPTQLPVQCYRHALFSIRNRDWSDPWQPQQKLRRAASPMGEDEAANQGGCPREDSGDSGQSAKVASIFRELDVPGPGNDRYCRRKGRGRLGVSWGCPVSPVPARSPPVSQDAVQKYVCASLLVSHAQRPITPFFASPLRLLAVPERTSRQDSRGFAIPNWISRADLYHSRINRGSTSSSVQYPYSAPHDLATAVHQPATCRDLGDLSAVFFNFALLLPPLLI
ncbi:hypothetical protein F4780DRAFT_27829 [Xylariomycetidae sp. FL0641]|nr:hypothetical protein F4780DRAFT_27829 [Xylariomycetidae sp. FL0641]